MTEKSPHPRDGALLTAEEAAIYLNISVRMVRRLRAEHRLRYVKIGRHLRFPVDALDALIAAGEVAASDPSPGPGGPARR